MFNFVFEKHSKLYAILSIISIFSLGYLNSVYSDFPISFPSEVSEVIDIELSFISSFRYGINQFPRFADVRNFVKYHKLLDANSEQNESIHLNEIGFYNFLFESNKTNFVNSQNPFYYILRPFFFSDPMRNGKVFLWPSLPLIYVASLNELGLSYSEASIIVCFFNTISTIVGIFFLSHFFLSKIDFTVVVIFLFCSGNSFFRFLLDKNENSSDFDLIHNFGKGRKCPFYSPILNLLSFSKHSSFALPISLFVLAFAHPLVVMKPTTYVLAGILLFLNPSASSSLALVIALSCYSNSIKYLWPFFLSVLPKLIVFNENFNIDDRFLTAIKEKDLIQIDNSYMNSSFKICNAISLLVHYKPLWREYQLQGIFYSPLIVWFDSFGFLFFFLILSPLLLYLIDSPILTQRFSASFASFAFFSFFRIGNDFFENSVAITSVFLPYLVFLYIKAFEKLDKLFVGNHLQFYNENCINNWSSNFFTNFKNGKSEQIRGVLKALKFVFASVFVLGTLFSAYAVSGFHLSHLIPSVFYDRYILSNNQSNQSFVVQINKFKFAEYLKTSSIHPRKPIFCILEVFNPITALAGRSIISGNFHEMWKRGADISEEIEIVKLVNQTKDGFTIMKELGYVYLLEIAESPFVIVNYSVINKYDVLYTDEKYIFLKIRNLE